MMRRIAQLFLCLLASLGFITAAEAAQLIQVTPEDPANPIAAKGCVIRFDTLNAAGTLVVPRIYEDSSHRCVGVTSVALETNGDLRINNTGGIVQIVSAWAMPDETLAATFRSCGISGGGTVSIVRCYKADGTRVRFNNIDDVYGPGSNIWFGGFVWEL